MSMSTFNTIYNNLPRMVCHDQHMLQHPISHDNKWKNITKYIKMKRQGYSLEG